MIHITQVKLPLERVLAKENREFIKHGIIGEEEKRLVKEAAASIIRLSIQEMKEFTILRKSMDARKKAQIQLIYHVSFSCKGEERKVKQCKKNFCKVVPEKTEKKEYANEKQWDEISPVVVGMGPAGLFAAYTLAKAGCHPIVLERGCDIDTRTKAVEAFWQGEKLCTNNNVQFGEGGAGTFSDGKLNTLVKDTSGRNRSVLQTFVDFGAPEQILYLQKPHIGTDRLRGVVKAMREEIIRLGATVLFETTLTDCSIVNGQLQEITIQKRNKDGSVCEEKLPCRRLVLAIGHSARDTFSWLYEKGISMEPKAFAMGVRVEHPQEWIGKNQYGDFYADLPTADYKLTYQSSNGRGVYSFCMCPGGYVVNASSEEGRLAINGMSYYERDGKNANSAIVVTVNPEDFPDSHPLAGVAFQRKWEEAAYRMGNGKIPIQRLQDFIANQKSTTLGRIEPCMKGAYALSNVREALPVFIGDAIAEGMTYFDRKIKGYADNDTILSGIESRTSSPVRILRNDILQANIAGIYPCGEGAGYAGGITSAGMDGIRVAQEILCAK